MVFIPIYLHKDLLVGPNLPLPSPGDGSRGQEASSKTKTTSCTFCVPVTLLDHAAAVQEVLGKRHCAAARPAGAAAGARGRICCTILGLVPLVGLGKPRSFWTPCLFPDLTEPGMPNWKMCLEPVTQS